MSQAPLRGSAQLSWRDDITLASIWFAISRLFFLGFAGIAHLSGWGTTPSASLPWLVKAFHRFDAGHLLRIAEFGYFSPDNGNQAFDEAFFPGYPLATRALARLVTSNPSSEAIVIAATVVTWVCAWIAGLFIVRITRELFPRITASIAAACWFIGPYAVFLMAPYTEALFAASSLASWYFAWHRRWPAALACATIACATRVNGAFILIMMAVMIIQPHWPHPHRSWWRVISLGIPALAPAAYLAYLWQRTGSITYWIDVQQAGWGRGTASFPMVIFHSFTHIGDASEPAIAYQQVIEIVYLVIFFAALWWCLRQRRMDWAALVWLSIYSLTRGPVVLSMPRNSLDCFPVIIAMAAGLSALARGRHRWAAWVIGVVGLAIAATNTLTLIADMWTG